MNTFACDREKERKMEEWDEEREQQSDRVDTNPNQKESATEEKKPILYAYKYNICKI